MSCATSVVATWCAAVLALSIGCGAERAPRAAEQETKEALTQAPRLSWEAVFRDAPAVSEAALSPSGDLLAVINREGRASRLRLHRLDAGLLLPLTKAAGEPSDSQGASSVVHGARQPTWSPDGGLLAWISADELWVAPVVTAGRLGERRTLVTLEGVRAPMFSPNGESIAVFASASGAQDLWVIELSSGEARQITEQAAEVDDVRFTPQWSPDGRWLAYVSNEADWWHDDLWLVEVESGKRQKISRTLMASSSPVWSPSSTPQRATLVAMGTAKRGYWYQDLADLYRIELDLGGARPRVIAEEVIPMQVFATDFIMRLDPFFSSDGEQVFFPYHERGAFDLWAVPVTGGVATKVTNAGGAWSGLRPSADASSAVFVRDAALEGKEAWVVRLEAPPARPVTRVAPRFADEQVPLEISFPSFDGLYLQGFLYLPEPLRGALAEGLAAADQQLRCPALVQVHGGGTNSYYQGRNLVEQVLAARGFPVLAINYRGGSGFGREFQDLAVEDWLNEQSKDPGAAADWLRRQPWSNGKVGIYGGSYGGMQSMSAITRTPEKFDAAVPMRGIYSEALTLPDADRLGKIFTITGHGGTPEERPEIYAKSETLDRLDQITAPVLVMHGERDVRAPFRNFELAVEKLEALGKEYESKTYDEGHAFQDPSNLIDMYQRLEDFFREHLGECR